MLEASDPIYPIKDVSPIFGFSLILLSLTSSRESNLSPTSIVLFSSIIIGVSFDITVTIISFVVVFPSSSVTSYTTVYVHLTGFNRFNSP